MSPTLHALLHPPASHLLLLLSTAGQALLHAPQLSGSVAVFTHFPPHDTRPGGQVATQLPLAHFFPGPHAVPQEPQNCGSLWVLTHAFPPFTGAQATGVEALHATPQAPAAQAGEPVEAPETGAPQTTSHPPQWAGSVFSSTHPRGAHESGKLGL